MVSGNFLPLTTIWGQDRSRIGMSDGKRIFNGDNLKKTLRYLKKNGLRRAYYAARERIEEEKSEQYHYVEPSADALEGQRRKTEAYSYRFSIVAPAYETKEEYLRAMIDSVRRQSYAKWELIIVDASGSGAVERLVKQILDQTGERRIRYRHLRENRGIAENTNIGLGMAAGDYIALLDHDDFLAPDALYWMAEALREAERQGRNPVLLYSDEDKFDDNNQYYMCPHRKKEFNLDLILSNNYICHFMAVKADWIKDLQLRKKYDGAQDYDLALRVVAGLWKTDFVDMQDFLHSVIHIPKVLYHWRSHEQSTAANTDSKSYAYEAGRMALEDFCAGRGWKVHVSHSLHLGFYDIEYVPDLMTVRRDVGIVGGRLVDGHGRICGGAYAPDGVCMYEGLPKEYTGGRTHRAALKQDVYAADVRCMQVAPALRAAYEEITGLAYTEKSLSNFRIADVSGLNCDEAGYRKISMELGRAAAGQGLLVLWDPSITAVIK